MVLIFLLYTLCALTFTLAKVMVSTAAPIFFVAVRMMGAGALLLCGAALFGKWRPIARRDWWLFFQASFFAIFVAYVGDLWSLQFITSSESALIFDLSPLITALFSYWWFGERMTVKKWIGLGVGMLSLIPLLSSKVTSGGLFHADRLVPLLVLIMAVASGAYGWIVIRELIKNRSYPILLVNGVMMISGGFFALILSCFTEWGADSLVGPSLGQFVLLTAVIIIVANLLFSSLYSFLLTRYTATLLSFAGFLCPFITALLGWFFLGEQFNNRFLWSVLAASGGLYLFYEEELRLGYGRHGAP